MNKKILSLASAGIAFLAVTGVVFAAETTSHTTADTTAKQAPHHFKGQADNQKLLTLLNIDSAKLKQELKAGKSLADIAVAQGKTEQDVIDLLMQQQTQRIDNAVAAGKLTKEKADQMKAKLPDAIKKHVEHKGLFSARHGGKHKVGQMGNQAQLKEIAAIIGADQTEVMTKLKAGESIAQIAQEHHVNKQDLIDKILQKDKERITQMVDKTWKKQDPAK